MYLETIAVLFVLISHPCFTKPVEDASVVSVYTTQPTTAGTGLDVYQQIATNIAERFSDHIYGLFGIEKNSTEYNTTTKKAWENIEILDDDDTTPSMEDNEIQHRDTEELSVKALTKTDKKPEKLTLFNSYLPVNSNYEVNETKNDVEMDLDDPISLDDVDLESVKSEGTFIFILEFLGSLWQLAWGAISSVFRPSS